MAHAVQTFIYPSSPYCYTIDGNLADADQKTTIEGHPVFQLRRAAEGRKFDIFFFASWRLCV